MFQHLGLDTMSFLDGLAGAGAATLAATCAVNAVTWFVRRPMAWPMSFMSCRQLAMVGDTGGAARVAVVGAAVPDPEAIRLSRFKCAVLVECLVRSSVCSSSERSSQSCTREANCCSC